MENCGKITALYSRLPVGNEDRDGGESGRFFDRSGYARMMDDIESGKVGICIMKDMSRRGRDYLQVGNAMEVFRRNNMRFIAVNNGIDSAQPETLEFAPFINIMSVSLSQRMTPQRCMGGRFPPAERLWRSTSETEETMMKITNEMNHQPPLEVGGKRPKSSVTAYITGATIPLS